MTREIIQLGIEDYEADECVKPLFDSLIRRQVDTQILKDLFFDTQIREYFQYLPPYIKNDDGFLEICLRRNMLMFSQLPTNMQTTQIIEKNLYIDLLENGQITLESNLYSQDFDIALASMKYVDVNFKYLLPTFQTNNLIIIEALKNDTDVWHRFTTQVRNIVINDDNLLKQFLTLQPKHYTTILSPEQQISSEFIKILLETQGTDYFLNELLPKNNDPEIALLALKKDNNNLKRINQKFSTPIHKFGAQSEAYNFLKAHLLKEHLETNIPPKQYHFSKSKI